MTFAGRTIVLDPSQDTLFIDMKASLYVMNAPSLNEQKCNVVVEVWQGVINNVHYCLHVG